MINIDKEKEEKFYANKDFCFSYSSLNNMQLHRDKTGQ